MNYLLPYEVEAVQFSIAKIQAIEINVQCREAISSSNFIVKTFTLGKTLLIKHNADNANQDPRLKIQFMLSSAEHDFFLLVNVCHILNFMFS